MSPTILEQFGAYLTTETVILFPMCTLLVMYFVYGGYVILFVAYLCLMGGRENDSERVNRNLYLTLTVLLFVLSTMFMVVETIYYIHGSVVRFEAVKGDDVGTFLRYQNWNDVQRKFSYLFEILAPVLLNIIAEWMLIHRCYCIWGFNKLVAIPLIAASAIINGLGLTYFVTFLVGINAVARMSDDAPRLLLVGSNLSIAHVVSSTALNLIITTLTAGRIQWIHRQVRAQGIYTSDRLVPLVSRFILESGMIYPIVSIVALIPANVIPPAKRPFDLFPLAALSAGIAPTLIMVRAKLNRNVESLQDAVSEIRFTSQPARRGIGDSETRISEEREKERVVAM